MRAELRLAGRAELAAFASRLAAVLRPGDVILAEGPTYTGALGVFEGYQVDVRQVPLDEDGLDPAAVETRIRELKEQGKRVKLLYTIPNFQNPTGVTLAQERRAELVRVCREQDVLVVEDNLTKGASGQAEGQQDLVGRVGDGAERVAGKDGESELLGEQGLAEMIAAHRAADEDALDESSGRHHASVGPRTEGYRHAVHFVIMGCGRVGSSLARTLEDTGHSVAIVDRDESAFRRLPSSFLGRRIVGVGFDRDTRPDPILPHSGGHLALGAEIADLHHRLRCAEAATHAAIAIAHRELGDLPGLGGVPHRGEQAAHDDRVALGGGGLRPDACEDDIALAGQMPCRGPAQPAGGTCDQHGRIVLRRHLHLEFCYWTTRRHRPLGYSVLRICLSTDLLAR